MSIQIDDILIEEIKDRADVVELISEYLPLERSGANYVGLCPFHSEKTPSFTVNENKQFYHCFGCGKSGDVIEFIMERENLTFPEAIKFLADRYGIELKEKTEREKKADSKREKAYEINRLTAKYFLYNLENNHMAQNYLKNRGINKKISRQFGLGYAHDSWESLYNFLTKRGLKEKELEELGLIAQRSNGKGYYDRFRNRLIFPIIDTRSRVIGFGGRVLDDSMPKYLNSKDTIVFNKGYSLYGLNMIDKYSDRENIILVEGYMDVIAMFANGIPYGVASLGTALTERQAKLLSRYGKNVYICFDSDLAGINATNKAINLLIKEDIVPKVIMLGEYKDPDDYFKENTKADFIELMNSALHFLDYKIEVNKNRYDLEDLEGKIEFTKSLSKDLSLIKNPIEKEIYIDKLSKDLNISKEAIEREIQFNNKDFRGKNTNKDQKNVFEPVKVESNLLPSARLSAEMEILKLSILDKKYYDLILDKGVFLNFKNETTLKILKGIEDIYMTEEFLDKEDLYDIIKGMQNLDDNIVRFVLKTDVTVRPDNAEKFINDLINTIELNKLLDRRKVVRREIEILESEVEIDFNKIAGLLKELTKLNEKIGIIRSL